MAETLATTTLKPPRRPMVDLTTLPLRIGAESLPADPAIRAVAHDVLNRLKYAFAIAAADLPVTAPGPVDLLFREFLSSRAEPVRARQRARATTLLQAPPASREATFGRYGRIEPAQYAAVGSAGLADLAGPLGVDAQRLRDAIAKTADTSLRLALPPLQTLPAKGTKVKFIVDPNFVKELQSKTASTKTPFHADPAVVKDMVEGARFKKLGLFIKEVECIEETNEPSDSDEINLGGVFTDADGQVTHLINEFKVSDDFDEGERVLYPPPVIPSMPELMAGLAEDLNKLQKLFADAYNQPGKKIAEWAIRTDLGWPTAYAGAIVMAEKDQGGFWKFLQELLGKIVEEVEKALKMGIGAAIGGVVGAKIGGIWGAVVGAVVGFIVGAIIDLITADNPDDIMGTAPLVMSFGAATLSYYQWTGLLKQPHPDVFPISYKRDGGHYRVWCYYQVYE
jgi:hypothetical protein